MTPHERIPALDGLRGAAALMVVVSHLSNQTNWFGGVLGFGGGQVGVMIFFALSGYLMGALYVDRPLRPADLADYAVHRIARVAPLYYAIVAASFGVRLAAIDVMYPVNATNIGEHVALIRGVGALWTIPVEMQFYAVFVLLWALRAWLKPSVFLSACAVLIVVPFFFGNSGSSASLFQSIDFFATGLIVSRLFGPNVAPRGAAAWAWNVAFASALALTLLLYPRIHEALLGVHVENMWKSPLYPAVVALLLAASTQAPLARALFGAPVMAFLGAISYSIYLLHMPVIQIVVATTNLRETPALFFAVVIGATLVVATAVYFFFERPARALINRITSKARPLAKAAA